MGTQETPQETAQETPPAAPAAAPPDASDAVADALLNSSSDSTTDDPDAVADGMLGDEIPVDVDAVLKDVEMPEGMDKRVIAPFVKDLKLNAAQAKTLAQSLNKANVDSVDKARKEAEGRIKEIKENWLDASKKDPVIGGDRFQASVKAAGEALKAMNEPEFGKILKDAHILTHPVVMRVLVKLREKLVEDAVPPGGGGTVRVESVFDNMYPSMRV